MSDMTISSPMARAIATSNARLGALRANMKLQGLDAVLISNEKNIAYLTNFSTIGADPEEAFLVVRPADAAIYTTPFYADKAQRLAPHLPLTTAGTRERPGCNAAPGGATLETFLNEELTGVKNLGVEMDDLTAARGQWLTKHFSVKVKDAHLTELQRVSKTPEEIAAMRKAIHITAVAMKATAAAAHPGVSEKQLGTVFKKSLLDQGAEEAFTTILAAGPHAAEPHFDEPTEDPLPPRSLLVMDVGAKIDGYNADMTRMIMIGQPTDEQKQILQLVETAQRAGIDKVAPGIPVREVDAAARKVIEDAGHGKDFFHGTGHGVGRDVHEQPFVSSRTSPDVLLKPGEVITVEPGCYLKGKFGVRMEDEVLVTDNGHEALSEEEGLPKVFYTSDDTASPAS